MLKKTYNKKNVEKFINDSKKRDIETFVKNFKEIIDNLSKKNKNGEEKLHGIIFESLGVKDIKIIKSKNGLIT